LFENYVSVLLLENLHVRKYAHVFLVFIFYQMRKLRMHVKAFLHEVVWYVAAKSLATSSFQIKHTYRYTECVVPNTKSLDSRRKGIGVMGFSIRTFQE